MAKRLCGLIALFIACPLWAVETEVEVDESRLWLPKSYQKYYLPLKQAAAAALTLERCQTLLEATMDLEQSRPDHPIFRVLCRQQNGKSYNEMVDGLTFETLTTQELPEPELTEEELERIRQEEEAKKQKMLAEKKADLWQQCATALDQATAKMIDLQWRALPPEPVVFDEEEGAFADFERDFDAKSIWGKPLQYRAYCSVGDSQPATVTIKKR